MKKTAAVLALLVGVVFVGTLVRRTPPVLPSVTAPKETTPTHVVPSEGTQSTTRTGRESAKESRRLDDLLELGEVATRSFLFDEATEAYWSVVDAPAATTAQVEMAWRGLVSTGRSMRYAATVKDPELLPEAEALLRELLASQERHLGVEAPSLAGTLFYLAATVFDGGDLTEAEALWNRGLRILEGCDTELDGLARGGVSVLAMTLASSGEAPHLALPLIERALAIDARTRGPGARSRVLEKSLLDTYRALGRDEEAAKLAARYVHEAESAGTDEFDRLERRAQALWLDANDPASAAETQRQLVEAREQALGPDHPEVLADMKQLDLLLSLTGDEAGQVRVARERLARLERVHGLGAPELVEPLEKLARIAASDDRPSDAVALYERTVALIDADPDRAGDIWVSTRLDLAGQLHAVGRHAEASQLAESLERGFRLRVHALRESQAQNSLFEWFDGYDRLARYHQARKAYGRSEELQEEALDTLGQLPATEFVRALTATTLLELVETLDADGRPDEATEQLARAVQAGALDVLAETATSLQMLGRVAGAEEHSEQIAEIRDRLGMQVD